VSKNPFRIIRIIAATIGGIALIGIFGFIFVGAIIMTLEDYGAEVLWQVPLTFAIFFGVMLGIGFICSVIAKLWKKAEQHWDQRRQGRES